MNRALSTFSTLCFSHASNQAFFSLVPITLELIFGLVKQFVSNFTATMEPTNFDVLFRNINCSHSFQRGRNKLSYSGKIRLST